mmetsp:Transcript_33417/g.76349  ORF Transcript_33417/g.76349 Transcript_33417/m.76349 type:complete len:208 (+) Transcript_33417:48-671(+)
MACVSFQCGCRLGGLLVLLTHARLAWGACPVDVVPMWPVRFKILQRRVPDADPDCSKGTCSNVTTYYDWERQTNLIIDSPDVETKRGPMHDLELGSHHSYYFYPKSGECNHMEFPVGLLTRDWLRNATSLGVSEVQGRKVVGWTKADFIDYYADFEDCHPVSWHFHTMAASFHTQTWMDGAAVEDESYFQPPVYCPNRTVSEQIAMI